MRALRPIVVLLLLGLVVAPAWASAQGHRPESRSALLDRLWSGDAGPVIDPDGLHSNIAALPASDEGAVIDPAGDAGTVIDPAGLRSDGDAGAVIDPWGVAGR